MVDIFSKKKRSDIMSRVRSKETGIEIKLRKELWKAGYRYQKNVSGYFGKPDILLKNTKRLFSWIHVFGTGAINTDQYRKHVRNFGKKKSSAIKIEIKRLISITRK